MDHAELATPVQGFGGRIEHLVVPPDAKEHHKGCPAVEVPPFSSEVYDPIVNQVSRIFQIPDDPFDFDLNILLDPRIPHTLLQQGEELWPHLGMFRGEADDGGTKGHDRTQKGTFLEV